MPPDGLGSQQRCRVSCSAEREMATAEHKVLQCRQCPQGSTGTNLSLQHLQEAKGEQ